MKGSWAIAAVGLRRAAWFVTLSLAAGIATDGFCQTAADVTVPTASLAQAERQHSFAIAPQSLADALARFGQQSGIQITVHGDVVRGVASPGISGTMSAEQALRQLLGGTGLTYRWTDANTVTLARPGSADPGVTVLNPITVEGKGETAYGPVNGYVATRSATGTKTDTPLIEVPQSVSVITRDQMDDRKTQTLSDTLRYTAGVQAGDTGDLTTESFAIRGFNSPFLSLHRDGTRAMFRAFDSVIEPYGLERVEVLKGPASVLYGQGVPGGVVNVVTKRPTETPLREAELQIGTFDRYQGAFDLGGPVTEDKTLQFRFTVLGRKSDTQTDFMPDDRIFVAPALTWRSPSKETSLTLLTSYQRDNTSFPDGLPAEGTVLSNPNGRIPTSRFVGEPDWSDFDRSSGSVGYIFDHRFSEIFSLHQTMRYTRSDYDRNQIQNRGLAPDLRSIDRRARQSSQGSDRINVDSQAEIKFGPDYLKNDVVAGVEYGWTRFTTEMSQGTIAPLDLFTPGYGSPVATPDPVFDDRETASQVGLYMQDQVKILNRLVVVGGFRKDWARDELDDNLGGTTTMQEDSAITYRFGAVYLAPYGFAPYVSYAQSFVPLSGFDANGSPFKPETGEQYEVGLKYQPPGIDSFITLSFFDLVRQNVQTPDPNDPFTFLVQTGEITSRGVELEGVASLTDNLSLIGTYTYLDAEVTKSNDVDLGKRPTTVPAHMGSFWADYTHKDGPLAGLGAGAGVRYIGRSPGDAENTFSVAAYTLVDAALRYNVGSFRLAVNVNNLFDKEYVSTCFALSSCYYGNRRSVIGTLVYTW